MLFLTPPPHCRKGRVQRSLMSLDDVADLQQAADHPIVPPATYSPLGFHNVFDRYRPLKHSSQQIGFPFESVYSRVPSGTHNHNRYRLSL